MILRYSQIYMFIEANCHATFICALLINCMFHQPVLCQLQKQVQTFINVESTALVAICFCFYSLIRKFGATIQSWHDERQDCYVVEQTKLPNFMCYFTNLVLFYSIFFSFCCLQLKLRRGSENKFSHIPCLANKFCD